MEIPGASYAEATQRYIYRMPEQENIWESFQLIMRRLRNFVDSPYVEGPDIFGTEDNSQLFCLREGLVNFAPIPIILPRAIPLSGFFPTELSCRIPVALFLPRQSSETVYCPCRVIRA